MSERPTSSIMFPICSFFLSISSCLAADRSSASHLWASDEPSSDHIRHGEAISARTFLVMVCFPQWQAPWLCVGYGWLSACLSSGTSQRYTDKDRGGDRGESQTHQVHPSVTVSKQCITPAHIHYQPAPCWEIYLRTVILSAKQISTRTHRWLILSRHSLIFHCLVKEICYTTVPV